MKLIRVEFDDAENPERFVVEMGLDEMALLYRLTGHVSPKTITEAFGAVRWGEALDDLASGAASILNRFYEDGANDVIPRAAVSLTQKGPE